MSAASYAAIAFGLMGFVALVLPLLPALRTLKQAPNRAPPQEAPFPPASQCETFRHLIARQFGNLLNLARTQGTLHGETESKRSYIVLGINNHLATEIPQGIQRLRAMVVATGHLDIPGELICEREIFAEGKINIGHSTMVKAVLSLRDIAINSKARVTRWVRSDRRIDIAESACVKGWANAGVEISLARRARFEHLSAPLISFGRQALIKSIETEIVGRFSPEKSPETPKPGRRLSVPDNHVVKSDLIATDKLVIGNECRVIGNIRAGKHLIIGAYSRVEGAIFCDGNITIFEGCQLSGPIVAKACIVVHTRCQVGTMEQPSTVTAPLLRIAEGSIAHGTVWATSRGDVFLQE
ncbi:MAG: hypothetical protein RJA63_1802 [Pseudomonadota bacterium]